MVIKKNHMYLWFHERERERDHALLLQEGATIWDGGSFGFATPKRKKAEPWTCSVFLDPLVKQTRQVLFTCL